MLRPKLSPEPGHTFSASLRGRNACQNFTSNFLQKFTGKMPQPKTTAQTFCASLRSRSACQDFTRVTYLYGSLQKKCRSPKPRPTLCAGLHSRNAYQDFIKSHLIRKLTGKMPQPKTTAQTLCEPAQSKRMSRFHKSHLLYIYTEIYEPAQSKRMSRFHKSHFIRKLTGKMPQPKTTAQTLCEPAQSKRMSRFHKSY